MVTNSVHIAVKADRRLSVRCRKRAKFANGLLVLIFILISPSLLESNLLQNGSAVDASEDAKRLYGDVFSSYDNLVRPAINSSSSVTVRLGLKLAQLLDVDEVAQVVTFNVWVKHKWRDYKLHWRPDKYGNITKIYVPASKLWLPDIVLHNNAEGNYQITIFTKATLFYDGTVVWEPPAIYKFACEISIEYFPYDIQVCNMKFSPWSHTGLELNLIHLLNATQTGEANVEVATDLREYTPSAEWDILRVNAIRREKMYPGFEEFYPELYFYFTMRRKTLFYTVTLVIPIVLISFLSLLVFYLPTDSGEKITLCISILLTLSVYFLLLIQLVPPTSNAVPLIGKYLLFTIIMITLSIIITISVLNIHYARPYTYQQMPPWVRQLFLHKLPTWLLMTKPEFVKEQEALQKFMKEQQQQEEATLIAPISNAKRKRQRKNNRKSRMKTSLLSTCGEKFCNSTMAEDYAFSVNEEDLYSSAAVSSRQSQRYAAHSALTPPTSNNAVINSPIFPPDYQFYYQQALLKNNTTSSRGISSRRPSLLGHLYMYDPTVWPASTGDGMLDTRPPSPRMIPTPHHQQALPYSPRRALALSPSARQLYQLSPAQQHDVWVLREEEERAAAHAQQCCAGEDAQIFWERQQQAQYSMSQDYATQYGGFSPRHVPTSLELPRISNSYHNPAENDAVMRQRSRIEQLLATPTSQLLQAKIVSIARHVKDQNTFDDYRRDWKFVGMVVDRLCLWIFSFVTVVGTCYIVLWAPPIYDTTPAIPRMCDLEEYRLLDDIPYDCLIVGRI